MNRAAEVLADFWFRHPVEVQPPAIRTALGTTMGDPIPVKAGVEATARTVTNAEGREVVVAATLRWATDGPLPSLGWRITLPDTFGLKPGREVVTARLNDSGTGLTPDHIEVTII